MLIAGWLAACLSHPGAAVTTHSGTLPTQSAEAIALNVDDAPAGFEQISHCLTEAGFHQPAPAKYLVQFSRTVRPRKTLVLTGGGEEFSGRSWKRIRSGKLVDTATLAISDVHTGDLLFRAETSRKLGRKPRDGGTTLDEMCDNILGAGLNRVD